MFAFITERKKLSQKLKFGLLLQRCANVQITSWLLKSRIASNGKCPVTQCSLLGVILALGSHGDLPGGSPQGNRASLGLVIKMACAEESDLPSRGRCAGGRCGGLPSAWFPEGWSWTSAIPASYHPHPFVCFTNKSAKPPHRHSLMCVLGILVHFFKLEIQYPTLKTKGCFLLF